ncbi:MAG: patatin family protein [Bulleidia sp.]
MRTGIIDAGGGYRGVYAAGIMDALMDHHITFNVGIGVSAGSANIASYIAGQRGRNLKFYTEYGMRKEYAGIGNYIHKRSYIDLDYVYSTLSNENGEDPVDYDTFVNNPMEMAIVATDAKTGMPKYFTKQDIHRNDFSVLKASCAIPGVCRPVEIDGVPYVDGGVSDPVPIDLAMRMGCEKIVVVLTRPLAHPRKPENDPKLAMIIRKDYPVTAGKLANHYNTYNKAVSLAKAYEASGQVCIIAPDDTLGVRSICHDPEAMRKLYQKGYSDAQKIRDYLNV